MSDKDGEKHVFSYMDGIPVKISERYKPPRKIVLPVGFQNRLLQPPVVPDYDFQLERDVIDKIQQWRKSRSEEKEKRKQRIAEEDAERKKMIETMQELENTMNELSTEEESQLKKQPTQSTSPVQVSIPVQLPSKALVTQQPVCPSVVSEGNPILRPIPFKHQVVSSQLNNNKPISAFNLSDFEADTSSPFDNMELKTINDLEELAQVLQPSTISQVPNYYQNTMSSDEHFGNMHHQTANCQASSTEQSFNLPSSNKMLNDIKCGANYQPHVNGYASNFDYCNMQSYHPQSVIPQHNPHAQATPYTFVDRELIPQPSEVSFTYTHQDTQPQLQNYYSSNVWPSVPYQQTRHEPSSFGNVSISESNAVTSNPLAFTLSSPPSSSEHPEDASPERDSTISSAAQQLNEMMKSRASKIHPKPCEDSTPENSSSAQSPTSPIQSDPFQSLNSESQHLVQKIAEMGFPIARVARACQNLGTSDKKIVEFLLSLQSLLDAGYQESRAERALSVLNQDVKAAIKYLQVESQLLDLGFPADRVSEALVKFNSDRDQALEFLIS